MPYVIEVGFAYLPHIERRVFLSGLNFSPALGANPFRQLGGGESLDGILAEQWADHDELVIVFVHLTTPKPKYLDKGKTQVAL